MATTYNLDVVIERDEDGGFVASVPALRGCHTQGDTLDELMANVREAIAACLEAGWKPEPVTIERVSVAA
jgi:predicted RNase H-like HicB family nuclease